MAAHTALAAHPSRRLLRKLLRMRTEIYHTSSDQADIAAKQRPHPWAAAARPRLEASSWGAHRKAAPRSLILRSPPQAGVSKDGRTHRTRRPSFETLASQAPQDEALRRRLRLLGWGRRAAPPPFPATKPSDPWTRAAARWWRRI